MTIIGPTVSIVGEIISEEDITIDGHVDGMVTARDATVAIGERGRIDGTVRAARVVVEGFVEGGVSATERIELRVTATVTGNLSAIRIGMAEGAHFTGGIDMAQRTIAARVAQFKAAAR